MSTPNSSTSDLWIRRFHPTPGRETRLVCLPHAGGSASFFFSFSEALAARTEVLAVQYPGRQDRRAETSPDNVEELVERIHEALQPFMDRPLVFFGHSMGAVLSFELARKVKREGTADVQGMILSGRRSPTIHREEQVHKRGDDALIAEIRQLSGTDSQLLTDPELIRMVLPAIRSDYKAIETYRYVPDTAGAPLSCPMSVLTGESDPRVSVQEAWAWQVLTDGAFTFRSFSGGHFYLTPQFAAVAAAISEDLASFAGVPTG